MSEIQSELTLERVYGAPPAPEANDLTAMAGVYADAFAGSPWNEYTHCAVEDRFFGKDTEPGQTCECGETTLVQAYPQEQTKDYITDELERPDSSLFLLRKDSGVVGFTWGFSYDDPEKFAIEKYHTPEMQEKVVDVLGRAGVSSSFYYLSESAINNSPELRGRGISKKFHELRLGVARELDIPAVQRTSCEGPMYRTSLSSGMEQIMGPEVVVDTQARTFNRTGRIVNDLIDSENEPRVLFVK